MFTKNTKRLLFLGFGWLFVILGFIGAFLPILPTTPFAILAAYCFSHGSEQLHSWILNQPLFGPLVRDWEKNRVIRRPAKIWATVSIVLLFSYTLIWVKVVLWIKVIVASVGVGVLTFIWTRAEVPKSQ